MTHASSLMHQSGETNKDGVANDDLTTFQKIRRRLTVTGASDTIDGVSKLSVSEINSANEAQTSSLHSSPCAVNEYAGMSKKGHAPYNPRKPNQDALIMTDDAATNTLILCTLDGHGEHGDAVANAFRDELARQMISHPEWTTDVKKAAADAIVAIETATIRNFRIDTEFSGTTLSMAIIRGNTITGVNIGDSRVIIGKTDPAGSGKIVEEEFTRDHKPDLPEEKKRIVNAGGRVFAVEYDDGIDGPPRVWLGHMDVPGLAMSRSLGDSVAHTAGVSSVPEFTQRELDPATDKFVVVATDGLWEFISNKETVDLVNGTSAPTTSVEILVKEANARWLDQEQVIDDTTVITAFLYDYKK
jgi:serine/threonine protein phosphatase PrpC